MNRRLIVKGLLAVSVIGMLCSFAWAANESGQDEPNKPAQQGQTTAQPGAAGTTSPQQGTAAQQQAMPPSRAPTGQEMTLLRTNQVIGKDVKDTQGEKLGTVHDIVLTPDYQQASYVAVSYGGVFSVGSKLYAIPWQALHVGPKGDITMSATRAQFQEATSFSNDNWPSRGDSRWLSASSETARSAMNSTGTGATAGSRTGAGESETERPSATTTGRMATSNQEIQMRRVTHLTGMEVKNSQDEDLGDIDEFAINASNGHVEYDIITFGGLAGIGEKYAAVPANAIQLEPQNHSAVLNTSKQTLESVAFSPSEFPNLSSPEYMQRLSKLFPAAAPGTALGYVPARSSQELSGDNDKAWGSSGRHAMSYNTNAVKTITGTVESVGSFKPEAAPAGAAGGLRLRVKTTDGNLVTVYAGPTSYAEQKDFFIMPGDQISITGSEAKIRSRTVILASELKKGSQTLELRDQSGKPLWSMQRQAGQTSTSSQTSPSGQQTRRGTTRPQ
jgi:sporulation protein YlmC with PRC-barrel domain